MSASGSSSKSESKSKSERTSSQKNGRGRPYRRTKTQLCVSTRAERRVQIVPEAEVEAYMRAHVNAYFTFTVDDRTSIFQFYSQCYGRLVERDADGRFVFDAASYTEREGSNAERRHLSSLKLEYDDDAALLLAIGKEKEQLPKTQFLYCPLNIHFSEQKPKIDPEKFVVGERYQFTLVLNTVVEGEFVGNPTDAYTPDRMLAFKKGRIVRDHPIANLRDYFEIRKNDNLFDFYLSEPSRSSWRVQVRPSSRGYDVMRRPVSKAKAAERTADRLKQVFASRHGTADDPQPAIRALFALERPADTVRRRPLDELAEHYLPLGADATSEQREQAYRDFKTANRDSFLLDDPQTVRPGRPALDPKTLRAQIAALPFRSKNSILSFLEAGKDTSVYFKGPKDDTYGGFGSRQRQRQRQQKTKYRTTRRSKPRRS